ncbi:transglycosylase domain-containing protein [Barrientosiimonas marina]|uniref:Transglycosylase domain-containing protein n=1 Tax=Lentibacillus kimchii TaxID=1542911 RepID=A0ABW2UT36_9BACI
MKKLKWLLLSFTFLLILGGAGFLIIYFGGTFLVDEDALTLDATTTIKTSDGELIGKLYDENREPVTLDDIPQNVQNAFIAIEDRRFYDHGAIDFKATVRAVVRDIIAMDKVEGGSTITQQLARNLFLSNDKTWMRKIKELMTAIYLERHLSKEKILQLYLNKVYFGSGVYGIEAAAWKYYDKSADELSLAEGAQLAGLVKAPNGYSPIRHPHKAKKRRNVVLQAMEETGAISENKLDKTQAKGTELAIQNYEPKPWTASFIDLVLQKANERYDLSRDELRRGGYQIVTTLDPDIQQIVYNKFQNDDYFAGNTGGAEGAFVMLERDTGHITAAVGGRDYKLGGLNRVTVKRQPGSAMKPLAVYGPAMMEETYQPYSLIPDRKGDIDGYTVTNYDDQYAGYVSLYDALVESKNVPTVWLLNDIGIPYAKDYLDKLGMPIKDKGLAIGLGGLSKGVTPLQVASGYRAFANDGATGDSVAIEKMKDREGTVLQAAETHDENVFSPQVAWDITSILSTVVTDGTGSAGRYPKALAGKTGTTQHPHVNGADKDAWFAGFTPEYVSAAWMGYDTSDAEHYLTAGSEMPTKLTKAILSQIDKRDTLAGSFEKPANVSALPEPIELPDDITLHGKYTFGGFSLFDAKLEWTEPRDDRIIYRIYEEKDEQVDKQVAEVKGDHEYEIDNIKLFGSSRYYVVPYDPLTKTEGQKSNTVELSMQ